MKMKFNIGDRVRIVGTGLERLNLDWRYLWHGVIVWVRTNATYPHVFTVRINEVKSDGSFCIGTYHFFEDELQLVVSSKYERRNELNNAIINVIFNNPATIVFWADGTKTVVKAQGDDIFDPEKGLAMAITKKFMSNKGNYCNELKKWLPKEEKTDEDFDLDAFDRMIRKKIADALTISLDEEPEYSMNKWFKKVKESLGIEAKDE